MTYSADNFPALDKMQPITLEEMSEVSLMNRTDTKFLTSTTILSEVLKDAHKEGYRVCEIEGERLLPYLSIYYDTTDLRMFTAHRNSKLVRQKIRVRTYVVSGVTYLEIKKKNNHRRTKKKRMSIPREYAQDFTKAEGAIEFLQKKSNWKPEELTPETTTDFDRITLVNKELTERITIDMNLSFDNFRSGKSANLGSLVIIELKQDGTKSSEFRKILLNHRIFPFRVSKYCMAVTLTDPAARPGRFKEKVRYIEKITQSKLL